MHANVNRLLALAGLLACAAGGAQAQIYLCVDAGGRKELTDTNRGGCRALDLPGGYPAPARRPPPAPAPQRAGGPAPASTPSPAEFPRVDNAEQKARDLDRRRILQDELKIEETKLAELKKEYNGGEPERNGNERNYAKYQERVAQMKDNLNRAERNIEALKREIANIR